MTFRFTSCGGRNRTCVGAVNSRLPVPTRVPPQSSQSGRLDLNQRSPASGAGGMARLSHVLIGKPCKSQKLVELQGQQPHASGPGGNRTRKFQSKSLVLYLRALFVGSCRWARSPERPAGVEPALPPWQGGRLPLHHGRAERGAGLSKIKSTRPRCAWCPDSNPRCRVTGSVSSPLDDQCISSKWGRWDSIPHRPV